MEQMLSDVAGLIPCRRPLELVPAAMSASNLSRPEADRQETTQPSHSQAVHKGIGERTFRYRPRLCQNADVLRSRRPNVSAPTASDLQSDWPMVIRSPPGRCPPPSREHFSTTADSIRVLTQPRPMQTVPKAIDGSPKRPFIGHPPTSARGGSRC